MRPQPYFTLPGSSLSQSMTASSSDDGVSPLSREQPKSGDYFRAEIDTPTNDVTATQTPHADRPELLSPRGSTSTGPSMSTSSICEQEQSEAYLSSNNGDTHTVSRKSSTNSVKFRPPRNPSLPQGHQRKTDARRLRASSPLPERFKKHIAFDNLPIGEATKNNPSSFTLNARHQGYHPDRRSRTFMAGVDEHAYSDYALAWLLENLIDDSDELVCVRVVEQQTRCSEKKYQEEARALLKAIQEKNIQNRAISIVLEYSVGKLHETFQQLIQIYQPSMLIVGTRGRSLGGIQGLVNSRNSFSKYCLQYSPVPVVVVRPDEQRKRKKDKRTQDPARQSYATMIANSQGKHEADSDAISVYELENQLSADEEAHRVAAAIGLPAAFDPTIKPYTSGPRGKQRPSSLAAASPATASASDPPGKDRETSPPPVVVVNDSGDEESGEDEEDEFEAVSGQQVITAQKERLHQMEVGEAKALLESGSGAIDEEDDDEGDDEATEERSAGKQEEVQEKPAQEDAGEGAAQGTASR